MPNEEEAPTQALALPDPSILPGLFARQGVLAPCHPSEDL